MTGRSAKILTVRFISFSFSSKDVFLAEDSVFNLHQKTGELQPHVHDWWKNHIGLQKGL